MDFARSECPAVQEQLDRLAALSPPTDVLGLERIRALLARLGNPHQALPPVFHIAGTNGKGSTCAFLRAGLEASGLTAHCYTSPHLVRFNERIRLAGKLIEDEALAALLAEVLDRAAGIGATFFEITTAAAFLAFSRYPADACIVEVGLGGRLDATNVIERPLICGIAQLGLDHQAFLGTRIEARTLNDLHEAYVGVVEVLSQYLQGGHPRLKARSIRMAELSQRVAEQLKLPIKQVDDIRVAALLYDMGDIEITAKVIRRAVGTLEEDSTALSQHTFQGRDFVLSLGPVISGAMPLLLGCEGLTADAESAGKQKSCSETPIGARIIRTVRDYTALTLGDTGRPKLTAQEAIDEMSRDSSAEYDAQVLAALEQLIVNHEPVDEEDPHLINA